MLGPHKQVGRRAVLTAGLAGIAGVALPGCALVPAGAPRVAPSPTATPLPGQVALGTLREALASAAGTPWPDAHAALIAWALGVTADQCVAVSLPAPTPVAATATPPAEQADPALVAALAEALGSAATAFREQSVAASSAHPLVWAAMATWALVTADQLADPIAAREPARSVLDPAEQSPDAARQAALDACAEVSWGIEVAAGAPGLSADEMARARGRLDAWAGHADALREALGPTPTPHVTPAQPWYELDRPADATAARALLARLEADALPVLGRSFAFGEASPRPPLLDALADAAADVPRWGGLVERWPGLPAS
ncbi:hypothetical protein [Propioniciclava soli]|uniref:hypothetical protein n=1 Tax=Propioniciclava soli TaxID=2775081 RepID=UPI001E5389E4|nr:hypothetical protein [Propioniciclava soli]